MSRLNEDFVFQVLEAVSEIPPGKVATYGQIAKLIGTESHARLVGRALQVSYLYASGYPCHRVVNSSGRLVPQWSEQRQLLSDEGVIFKGNNQVDMNQCLWESE